MKIRAIWCDLDGTLCNVDHRLHILREREGEDYWTKIDAFTSKLHLDIPNDWCLELLWGMRLTGHEIIYITGRSDKYLDQTMAWLMEHVHFHGKYPPILFMRPEGNKTEDHLLKQKIYEKHIKPKYDIAFCLEDRPSVARTCRRLGLVCLQVDDKEF